MINTNDPDGADHYGRDDERTVLPQNDATDAEKIDGIVAQTRQDVADQGDDDIARVLLQRIEQAGVTAPDDVSELVRRVKAGA